MCVTEGIAIHSVISTRKGSVGFRVQRDKSLALLKMYDGINKEAAHLECL